MASHSWSPVPDKLKDSRLRYRENATLLLERAKALPPADLERSVEVPRQRLLAGCHLTPDLEAAYRIFSVLNNRGLDPRLSTSSRRRYWA